MVSVTRCSVWASALLWREVGRRSQAPLSPRCHDKELPGMAQRAQLASGQAGKLEPGMSICLERGRQMLWPTDRASCGFLKLLQLKGPAQIKAAWIIARSHHSPASLSSKAWRFLCGFSWHLGLCVGKWKSKRALDVL